MHHKLDTRTASSRVFLAALVIGVLLTTLPPASFAAPVSEADTSFVELEEVVVTATRSELSPLSVPAAVSLLEGRRHLFRRQCRNLPEALGAVSGVMVQKTAHGQGSPYLRGFTGFRTLLLVDGVRLNNSVFRDGPNQYSSTIDPLSLERVEVLKGPASVLYGSDAVGGTVNSLSIPSSAGTPGFEQRLYYRYSSADASHVSRAALAGSVGERAGFAAGLSVKDFGDVRAGGQVGLQPHTGYDEWDLDLRLDWRPAPASRFSLLMQHVSQDDVWRTHKTIFAVPWEGTDTPDPARAEKRRSLDQRRTLFALDSRLSCASALCDELRMTLSLHLQSEERLRIRPPKSGSSDDRTDRQGFDVATVGFSLQSLKRAGTSQWTWGAEFYRDGVDSFRRDYYADGSLKREHIQGPVADDARYDLLGIYLQNRRSPLPSLDLLLGLRHTHARAVARKLKDPVSGEATSLSAGWSRLVSSAHLMYYLDRVESVNLFAGVSQAFRAPNLSDLTRFDTARSDEIETPAPGLDPENFLTMDLGVKVRKGRLSGQLATYYTLIEDLIFRTPTGRMIEEDHEVTKLNGGSGFVKGVEGDLRLALHRDLSFSVSGHWIDGETDTYPTSTATAVREPLSRLMPAMLAATLNWSPVQRSCWAEIELRAAEKQDRLSSRDRADTQRIPPGGTPGYAVWTLRGGWRPLPGLELALAFENLSDEDYRIHGSGQNEAGRGVVCSLDLRF